jgi:hypothetical protein
MRRQNPSRAALSSSRRAGLPRVTRRRPSSSDGFLDGLVEQTRLQLALSPKGLDLGLAQGADVMETGFPGLLLLGCPDQAPISDARHVGLECLFKTFHLGPKGAEIAGIAWKQADADGLAVAIGQQPHDELLFAADLVRIMAKVAVEVSWSALLPEVLGST